MKKILYILPLLLLMATQITFAQFNVTPTWISVQKRVSDNKVLGPVVFQEFEFSDTLWVSNTVDHTIYETNHIPYVIPAIDVGYGSIQAKRLFAADEDPEKTEVLILASEGGANIEMYGRGPTNNPSIWSSGLMVLDGTRIHIRYDPGSYNDSNRFEKGVVDSTAVHNLLIADTNGVSIGPGHSVTYPFQIYDNEWGTGGTLDTEDRHAFIVDTNGNVGVHTTEPKAALHVDGSLQVNYMPTLQIFDPEIVDDNLLYDPAFDISESWTNTGSQAFTYSAGQWKYEYVSGYAYLEQITEDLLEPLLPNQKYKFTMNLKEPFTTTYRFTVAIMASDYSDDNILLLNKSYSNTTTYATIIETTDDPTSFKLRVSSVANSSFTIDNMSLEKITGGTLTVNEDLIVKSTGDGSTISTKSHRISMKAGPTLMTGGQQETLPYLEMRNKDEGSTTNRAFFLGWGQRNHQYDFADPNVDWKFENKYKLQISQVLYNPSPLFTDINFPKELVTIGGNLDILNRRIIDVESTHDGDFGTDDEWITTEDFTYTDTPNTMMIYEHSTGTGTVEQLSEDMDIKLKPNRWYNIAFQIGGLDTVLNPVVNATNLNITLPVGFSEIYELPVWTDVHQTLSYVVKTGSDPSDFVFSVSSTEPGTICTFQYIKIFEIIGGDLMVSGKITGGGPDGIDIDGDGTVTISDGLQLSSDGYNSSITTPERIIMRSTKAEAGMDYGIKIEANDRLSIKSHEDGIEIEAFNGTVKLQGVTLPVFGDMTINDNLNMTVGEVFNMGEASLLNPLDPTGPTMVGDQEYNDGRYGKVPVTPVSNPDTSGYTITQLETEVNELKQLLRDAGFIAP